MPGLRGCVSRCSPASGSPVDKVVGGIVIRKNVKEMTGYTPGEQPRRAGLVKLNTNENPYPPSPRVVAALSLLEPADLRLYPDPMALDVRQSIARLHGVTVDHVFSGNGSDEILSLCTRAFVEDGDAIGYFDPSYSLYPVLAAIRNVPGWPCRLDDAFGWPCNDPEPCALFFLTNPNAPTSLAFPLEKITAFCRAFPGVVLIDEAYVDFAPFHCMELAKTFPNVLVMRTLSKSYSLAGIRFGYVVGSPDLIGALFKIKDSYNIDRITQVIARAAIEDQGHMMGNVARIKSTRARLTRGLTALDFEVSESASNFLWARPKRLEAQKVFESLKAEGVLVRYFPGERTGFHVRITVGTDAEADRLLAVLGGGKA